MGENKNNKDIAIALMCSDSAKFDKLTKKSSIVFNFFIILLNFFVLTVFWFVMSNNNSSANLLTILKSIRWEFVLLIVAILILMLIINTLSDCVLLYSKTKKSRFWSLLLDNVFVRYVSRSTIFSSGGYSIFSCLLKNKGVEDKIAVDVSRSKKITKLISVVLYSFVVVGIGTILYYKKINKLIFALAIVAFVVLSIILFFILIVDKKRVGGLNFVSKICKILYKCRLIKEVDSLYNKIVNEIVVGNRALRSSGKIITFQIVTNMINVFLKQFILYVVLLMINFDISGVLFEIVLMMTVLDLIAEVWILPEGLLMFEILFVSLFNNLFIVGYLQWALILYRVIIYFFPIICESVIVIIYKIKQKKSGHLD